MNNYKITIAPELILQISQYSNHLEVFREIIANSYDAYATDVNVIIKDDKIIFEDNGRGMSKEELQNYLKTGKSIRTSEYNEPPEGMRYRKPIGRKGVGKWAPWSICNVWKLFSYKKSFDCVFSFDKNKFLQSQEVGNYDPEECSGKNIDDKHGIRIECYNLHSQLKINKIDLRNFLSRFPLNNEFRIYFDGEQILQTKSAMKEKVQIHFYSPDGSLEVEGWIGRPIRQPLKAGIMVTCQNSPIVEPTFFHLFKQKHYGYLSFKDWIQGEISILKGLELNQTRDGFDEFHEGVSQKKNIDFLYSEMTKYIVSLLNQLEKSREEQLRKKEEYEQKQFLLRMAKSISKMAEILQQMKKGLGVDFKINPLGNIEANILTDIVDPDSVGEKGDGHSIKKNQKKRVKGDNVENPRIKIKDNSYILVLGNRGEFEPPCFVDEEKAQIVINVDHPYYKFHIQKLPKNQRYTAIYILVTEIVSEKISSNKNDFYQNIDRGLRVFVSDNKDL